MISNYDMEVTKYDVSFIITIFLATHILHTQINKTESLFNNKWRNMIISLVFGYILYDLLIKYVTKYFIDYLQITNPQILLSLYDTIKYGTIYIVKELIEAQLNNKIPNFNIEWQMKTGFTILGYVIYDTLGIYLPNVDKNYQKLFRDIIKISFGELVRSFMMKNTITTLEFENLLYLLIGVALYHLFIRDMITKNDNLYFGKLHI